MPGTFSCPTCGAPVEPAPNKTRMSCPYCGTSLNIPAKLRWKQAVAPQPPAQKTPVKRFDPFRAAENTKITGEKAKKNQSEIEFVTNALRKAQALAAGAVSAYALWVSLKQFLLTCLIVIGILFALSCGVSIFLLFFIGRGN